MICLANSYRDDGRCVAGIDIETGQWVRPVPPGGGAIPLTRTWLDRRALAVLDIVELDLEPPMLRTRFQRENCTVRSWDWRVVGSASRNDVVQYCDDTTPILHSSSDRVTLERLEGLPPNEWQSLQLVCPCDLTFERDYWDSRRFRVRFTDSAGDEYYLRTTDPAASSSLQRGEELDERSLLTVSLAEPWAPPGSEREEQCYKMVAAVI